MPTVWQHELFHADGTASDAAEIALIHLKIFLAEVFSLQRQYNKSSNSSLVPYKTKVALAQ